MSECQKCKSDRIALISAKCDDCCYVKLGDKEKDGYAPYDMGVDGGDYVTIHLCLECGQVQGKFPLPKCEMEQPEDL